MTRQCAWCDCYLDLYQSGSEVTHGICEACAERIMLGLAPILKDVRMTTPVGGVDGGLKHAA
jgi:hypothetical protein